VVLGGDISGTGWSQTFVVNRTGTWTITVYRAANGYYAQSETASITISVTKGPQAQVTIIPTTWYTTVGNSITFTATGGSGTGVYQWGGDASGTGTSVSVRFLSAGTHTVTCYRHGDSNYFDSNTASLGVSIGQ
jgi:plastocyanin